MPAAARLDAEREATAEHLASKRLANQACIARGVECMGGISGGLAHGMVRHVVHCIVAISLTPPCPVTFTFRAHMMKDRSVWVVYELLVVRVIAAAAVAVSIQSLRRPQHRTHRASYLHYIAPPIHARLAN